MDGHFHFPESLSLSSVVVSDDLVVSDELKEVMANLRTMVEGYRQFPSGGVTEDRLRIAFDAVFDRYVVLTHNHLMITHCGTYTIESVESDEEMNYQEIFDDKLELFQQDFRLKDFAVKASGPCSITYVMRIGDSHTDTCIKSDAHVRNGKILRVERKAVEHRFRVAGQVCANKSNPAIAPGFPTEADLSAKVLPLPKEVRNKLLAQGTKLVPVQEKHALISVSLHHERKSLLSLEDVFSVMNSRHLPYAGGVYFKQRKRLVREKHLVMYDKSQSPIALCVQDRLKTCTICGREPLRKGDTYFAEESGKRFYPWFQVPGRRDVSSCDILVWNGNEIGPLWKASGPSTNLSLREGGKILIADRHRRPLGFVAQRGRDESVWDIVIAPGVDPAALICVVIILTMP